ncbi:MAG: hypothetical protein KF817_03535 [Phycisphaeraceae bacterium]|nr:hypothetical protein [Phycisphaeraceae bacterium]
MSARMTIVTLAILSGCTATFVPPSAARSLECLGFHAMPLQFGNRMANVSWFTREMVYLTRHQWDSMAVDPYTMAIDGYYGDRPVTAQLIAGGEGEREVHDWALVRVSPPRSIKPGHVAPDRRMSPNVGDLVTVQTFVGRSSRPDEPRSAETFSAYQVFGRITRFTGDMASHPVAPEARHPAGLLIEADLDAAVVRPGWSGSPAFVWDARAREWRFLGIVITAKLERRDFDRDNAGSATVILLRPPLWTFDLIPPDVPGVTMPGLPVVPSPSPSPSSDLNHSGGSRADIAPPPQARHLLERPCP